MNEPIPIPKNRKYQGSYVPIENSILEEYQAAVEDERFNRNIPFLNLKEMVYGFPCLPITLEKLCLFQTTDNSCFATSIAPTLDDVFAFLWILHPWHDVPVVNRIIRIFVSRKFKRLFVPQNRPVRQSKLNKWLNDCAVKTADFQDCVAEIRKFIADSTQDRIPGKSNAFEPEYFSDAAWLCAQMGREYGWTRKETMETPIAIIHQMLREIRVHHLGSKAAIGNKSSEILHRKN